MRGGLPAGAAQCPGTALGIDEAQSEAGFLVDGEAAMRVLARPEGVEQAAAYRMQVAADEMAQGIAGGAVKRGQGCGIGQGGVLQGEGAGLVKDDGTHPAKLLPKPERADENPEPLGA